MLCDTISEINYGKYYIRRVVYDEKLIGIEYLDSLEFHNMDKDKWKHKYAIIYADGKRKIDSLSYSSFLELTKKMGLSSQLSSPYNLNRP